MPLRTAVIGCGAISRYHMAAVLADERFELTALLDPDADALQRARLSFQTHAALHTALEDLGEVDAAIVGVPPGFHAEVVGHLLRRRIHVLCEKPMGTNVDQAARMIDAANASGVTLAVGFMRRFSPNTRLLKRALERDYIGQVSRFTLVEGARTDWDAANPRRFDPTFVPGGVLYESGIHWVDRVIHWFGEPTIQEFQDDRLAGVEANAYAVADFIHGGQSVRGTIRLSWTENLGSRLEVIGTEGRLILEDKQPDTLTVVRRLGRDQCTLLLPADDCPDRSLFQSQLDAFWHAANRSNDGVLASGEDARRALQFIQDAYQARQDMPQPWVFAGLLDSSRRGESDSDVRSTIPGRCCQTEAEQ